MKFFLSALLLIVVGCGGENAAGVDNQLVGRWRNTTSNSVIATDLYLNLFPNGQFEYSSRSEGPRGSVHDGPFRGAWKAEGGQLLTKQDEQDWHNWGTYRLSGNSMVLNGRLWVR